MASLSVIEMDSMATVADPSVECVNYAELSKIEQKIVDAYSLLVDELFLLPAVADVHGEPKPSSREFHVDLKRFLEMFVAIYRNKNPVSEKFPSRRYTSLSDLLSVCDDTETRNAKILDLCMTKFRTVCRRYYRALRYLTCGRLREALKKAEEKAISTFKTFIGDEHCVNETEETSDENKKGEKEEETEEKREGETEDIKEGETEEKKDMEDDDTEEDMDDDDTEEDEENQCTGEKEYKVLLTALRGLLREESIWIEKVNICRRTDIADSIQDETLCYFREEIEAEFRLLYGDSETDFYEFGSFQSQYSKMVLLVTEDFVDQIPFQREAEEDITVVDKLTSDFKDKVKEGVIDDLIERNVKNIRKVKSIMKVSVQSSVNTYKKDMSKFVQSMPSADHTEFLKHHDKLKVKCAPDFGRVVVQDNAGSLELEVNFTNQYQTQIHESFGEIIKNAADDAADALKKCQLKNTTDLAGYTDTNYETFTRFSISTKQSDKLRQVIEEQLAAIIKEAEDKSLKNVKNIDYLIGITTPRVILTVAERVQRDAKVNEIMAVKQQEYVNTLSPLMEGVTDLEVARGHHESVKGELTKQLKTIFIDEFGIDEPSDLHVTTFHVFTDGHWQQKQAAFGHPQPQT